MTDFKQIDRARKLLNLKEEASISEIKDVYRKLTLKYHPDKCKDKQKKDCEEKFKQITEAYNILISYCAGYRYSFREKDIKQATMDQELYDHLKRYYSEWWGD
ncbi:MAG: DnaJ domain-containing protein [Candidatus Hydrogenedentota bacterium]